jgi:5-oxoprolinase (ATP-hydrolysing)
MQKAFDELHRRRFGFADEAEPIVDTLTVEAVAGSAQSAAFEILPGPGAEPVEAGAWAAFQRADLAAGQSISGPALILETSSATVVEAGWSAARAGRRDADPDANSSAHS